MVDVRHAGTKCHLGGALAHGGRGADVRPRASCASMPGMGQRDTDAVVPPTRAARHAAAAAVGWRPMRFRDVAAVTWTTACDGVPAGVRGPVRAVLAAWCWPGRLLVVAGGRYHRDDRRTTVSLVRTPSIAWTVGGGAVAVVVVRGLRDALPERVVATAALGVVALLLYGLTVAVLQWQRNRGERTPAERRGLMRTPAQLRTTWWLGRVATRNPDVDRREVLARAAELVRAVTAPGETVGAAAKSDRQQRELEEEGFAEPRGHKGLVVYPPPGAAERITPPGPRPPRARGPRSGA